MDPPTAFKRCSYRCPISSWARRRAYSAKEGGNTIRESFERDLRERLTRKWGWAKSLASSRDSRRLEGENLRMISSQIGLLLRCAGRNAGTGCGSVGFSWEWVEIVQNRTEMRKRHQRHVRLIKLYRSSLKLHWGVGQRAASHHLHHRLTALGQDISASA